MYNSTRVTSTYPCDAGGHYFTHVITAGPGSLPDEVWLMPPKADFPKHPPELRIQGIPLAGIPYVRWTAANQESWWVVDYTR